jgi:hypothetical protein
VFEPLLAISLRPISQGFFARGPRGTAVLTPDDLQREGLWASRAIVSWINLRLPADAAGVRTLLHHYAGAGPLEMRRVEFESYLEQAGKVPTPGVIARSADPKRAELRDAAIAAGDYLLRHQGPSGRFDYEVGPGASEDYSMARHSGAAWFLARLSRSTGLGRFGDAADRAIDFMASQTAGCARGCVREPMRPNEAELGGAALGLLAVSEASGDRLALGRRLAQFLLFMQRPNGDFHHYYDVAGDRVLERQIPFFTGEATLALARFAAKLNERDPDRARFLDAARRAMRWLTVDQYDFFAGKFVFNLEHWTCQAAEALVPYVSPDERERDARFCTELARYERRFQIDDRFPAWRGAYDYFMLAPPETGSTASITEGMLSSLVLSPEAERPAIRAQIDAACAYLISRQRTRANGYLEADSLDGGFTAADPISAVRIDNVQHAGMALLRAASIAE